MLVKASYDQPERLSKAMALAMREAAERVSALEAERRAVMARLFHTVNMWYRLIMIWDRGELVEVVAHWLESELLSKTRFPVGDPEGFSKDVLAEGLVDVVEAELRRQHGDRVRAGLEAARGRGGGRGGRTPALGRLEREDLVRDSAVMTYAELSERYGLSVSTVGRYLRGEV